MRLVLCLAAFAALACAADLQIDHVTAAGSNLKDLESRLAAAGLNAVYGGPHTNRTTEMSLVSFPDGSYLELIALQQGAEPGLAEQHEWAKFLKANAGPCAWALRVKDIGAEVKRLESAGVKVSPPQASGRRRPDGVQLEWQTSQIGEETRGTFFPFLIQDRTPRERRAFPQGKPVTREYKGVAKVVIAVRNLDEAVKRYRQAFGAPEPIRQVDKDFGAYLALLGGVPVILAQPLTVDNWLADRIARFGEAPCAFLLTAARPDRVRSTSEGRWFGTRIRWLDAGWRLGAI